MFGTIYTSMSGIQAMTHNLHNIGHNINNVNTFSFKKTRMHFTESVNQSYRGSGLHETGHGAVVADRQTQFSQGNLRHTGNLLDFAIQGEGFFLLKGQGANDKLLTRKGSFQLNSSGKLVNEEGRLVLGYNENNKLSEIDLANSKKIKAKASSALSLSGNLDLEKLKKAAESSDQTSVAEKTGQKDFSLSFTDPNGVNKNLKVRFETDPASEKLKISVFDADAKGDAANKAIFSELITNADNKLGKNELDINLKALDGSNQNIKLDISQITTYAGKSDIRKTFDNGFAAGELTSLHVENDGKVYGNFDNGQKKVIATLAMANVIDKESLQGLGNGVMQAPDKIRIGKALNDGFGSINSGFLENSNVELSEEMVEMIKTQQGFQANSKSLTTADQVMNVMLSLAR